MFFIHPGRWGLMCLIVLVPAHPGCPGLKGRKMVVDVCYA